VAEAVSQGGQAVQQYVAKALGVDQGSLEGLDEVSLVNELMAKALKIASDVKGRAKGREQLLARCMYADKLSDKMFTSLRKTLMTLSAPQEPDSDDSDEEDDDETYIERACYLSTA